MLALHAPAVAGERFVIAHDAMAGGGDGADIGRTRPRHRAHGVRRTDALGNVRAVYRSASWDPAQRLPDSLLEGRAPHIEGQIEPERRRLDAADHRGHRVLKVFITTEQLCRREAVLERAHERLAIAAEQDGTDALIGGGDQD
jgi:hypothetical protein